MEEMNVNENMVNEVSEVVTDPEVINANNGNLITKAIAGVTVLGAIGFGVYKLAKNVVPKVKAKRLNKQIANLRKKGYVIEEPDDLDIEDEFPIEVSDEE